MTEIGVDEIVPWAASRSVAQWRGERGAKPGRSGRPPPGRPPSRPAAPGCRWSPATRTVRPSRSRPGWRGAAAGVRAARGGDRAADHGRPAGDRARSCWWSARRAASPTPSWPCSPRRARSRTAGPRGPAHLHRRGGRPVRPLRPPGPLVTPLPSSFRLRSSLPASAPSARLRPPPPPPPLPGDQGFTSSASPIPPQTFDPGPTTQPLAMVAGDQEVWVIWRLEIGVKLLITGERWGWPRLAGSAGWAGWGGAAAGAGWGWVGVGPGRAGAGWGSGGGGGGLSVGGWEPTVCSAASSRARFRPRS